MALAYFITFSTYGTWLHGTDKGMGSVDREHRKFGEEFVDKNVAREKGEMERMTQEEYLLDEPRRIVVRDAIVDLCREKKWRLMAVHVRSNHVHVVLAADREAGRTMSDLKGRASRELTVKGFENADRKRWTRHGSTVHLFDETSVQRSVEYVLERQGKVMQVFDGKYRARTDS